MANKLYEFNFISEPPEELKCSICFEVAKEPRQHEECGKIFCRECIEKNGRKPCPNCRGKKPKYFKDMKSAQEIKALPMRCENVERGCIYKITVETLHEHATKCPFTLVSCPNKCKVTGEVLLVIKNDLNNHLKTKCPNRDYKCEHCGEKGTFASITQEHEKECKKTFISCPNQGCLSKMRREEVDAHVKRTCDYTVVNCQYQNIGCEVKKIRKDIQKHNEDDSFHLRMALGAVSQLHTTVMELQSANSERNKTLRDGESMIFKMSGFSLKKENDEQFFSEPFMTNLCGYKMHIQVYANGNGIANNSHVSVFAHLLEGPHNDTLHWPFLGNVKIEVLNQLMDSEHYTKNTFFDTTNDIKVGDSWGCQKFIPHSKLSHDPATNIQYLMDDTLYFRVIVTVESHKPWLACAENETTKSTALLSSLVRDSQTPTGTSITFKLSNYSTRKKDDDRFLSEEFYTSTRGYKMCIQIDANGNGDGSGTHVSMFTKMLEGPYDSELRWPYTGTVKCELLNQLADNNHHSVTSTFSMAEMLIGSSRGHPKFISHAKLSHESHYLMDDTLYFRLTVIVDGHKPWLACTHHTK